MDRIRYLIIPLTTALGVAGFLLGGTFVWLGAATFPVLLLADVILPKDFKLRAPGTAAFADFAIQLQLPLMIGLYVAFVLSVNNGSNPVTGPAASAWQIAGSMPARSPSSALPRWRFLERK
jgi:alkane 1-monooxygenase